MLTATANARNPYIVARTLASQGLAVFPVRAKQPLTPRGVYSATPDLDLLARMDGWRNADGCGLATGEVSGVDVLDVDVRGECAQPLEGQEFSSPRHDDEGRDGFAALAAMGALPETLAAQTPSGGRHFYFRHVVGGRSRKLCADGSVEWFSTGKLVVVLPAPGRTWLNHAEIVEAPDWLRAMVLTTPCMEEGELPGPLVAEGDATREGSEYRGEELVRGKGYAPPIGPTDNVRAVGVGGGRKVYGCGTQGVQGEVNRGSPTAKVLADHVRAVGGAIVREIVGDGPVGKLAPAGDESVRRAAPEFVNRTGWRNAAPLSSPAGVAQADRLMDATDARDRADLIAAEARRRLMK